MANETITNFIEFLGPKIIKMALSDINNSPVIINLNYWNYYYVNNNILTIGFGGGSVIEIKEDDFLKIQKDINLNTILGLPENTLESEFLENYSI